MDTKRKQQFDIVEKTHASVRQSSADMGIRLDNIEVVVPFVDGDFDLHVVIFFQTDADLEAYRKDGTTVAVQETYCASLRGFGYPDDWLAGVTFEFDSKENVDANFEGSYFYRMR